MLLKKHVFELLQEHVLIGLSRHGSEPRRAEKAGSAEGHFASSFGFLFSLLEVAVGQKRVTQDSLLVKGKIDQNLWFPGGFLFDP